MFSHNGLFSLLFLAIVLIIVIGAYLYYLSTQRKFSFVTSPAGIIIPLAIILTATELVVMDIISVIFNQHISITESLIDASILIITTFPLLYIWLHQQSQQISLITNNIADALIVINSKGEIEYFNPAAERIFGYNSGEVIGQKVNILMPEPHRSQHDKYMHRYLSTHVPDVLNKGRINLTALRKNGEEFPMYIAINSMKFYGREFFVASIQDITEQKKAEEKIILNEKKYHNLFEHNADAIFVADTKTGLIVDANQKASELIGRTKEDILTLHQTQLHPTEEMNEIADKFQKAIQSPIPITVEANALHKDGRKIPIEISTSFYTDPEGKQRIIGVFRNVSERKEAEDKIKQNEEMLREAQKIGHLGHWAMDMLTGSTYWSQETFDIFGLSYNTIPEFHLFTDRIHPDDRERVMGLINEAFSQKVPSHNFEYRIISADNKIKHIFSEAKIEYDTNGNPLKLVGIVQDITERKRALQYANDITDSIVDAVVIIDEKGTIQYFNPAAAKLFGYNPTEVLSKNVSILMPEPYEKEHDSYIRHYIETGEKKIIGIGRELIARRKNMSLFPIYLSVSEIPSSEAKQFIGIIHDITERKLSEDKIKQSETMLREAQQIGHLGHWDWNIMTNDLYWSDEIYRIFGLVPQQFTPSYPAFLETIHPADRDMVVNAVNDAIEGKSEYSIEHRIVLPDGQVRIVHEQGNVSRDSDGKPLRMIGIVHDITERKEYEDALEKIKDAALDASKAKSDFLANMSHEIRTPMNTTLGVGELLKETDLTPEQRKYVDMFQKSGEHLLTLINDILDLSKIEAGHMELENTDFSLLAVIEEVRSILAPKATEKGIRIITKLDGSIPPYLVGDPHRLRQVLINLTGNSLKFTSKGSITIKVKVDKAINSLIRLVFEVKDTGIGIPADKLDKLFKNFTQVDSSTTRQYGGTGLGLVISKKIIEMMNGHIWVESESGKGSSFFFDVELEMSGKVAEKKKISLVKDDSKIAKNLNLRHIHLLLVEDSEDNRQLIRLYMKDSNMTIDEAENGEIALNMLKNNKYDIVLMDIQMPVMDGYEATRLYRKWESKERNNSIPIIGLSANAFKDDREKALRAGCTEYLTKPVRKHQLLEMLKNTLTDML